MQMGGIFQRCSREGLQVALVRFYPMHWHAVDEASLMEAERQRVATCMNLLYTKRDSFGNTKEKCRLCFKGSEQQRGIGLLEEVWQGARLRQVFLEHV
mmetsp:Transcript_31567/g.94882  ORF Transcript_31567/g.94882 Transcript_31567/m.94882 type:complete len:98 (+) Transcript_31567:29-322(+)